LIVEFVAILERNADNENLLSDTDVIVSSSTHFSQAKLISNFIM
jgi:hypothetical protein